MHIQAFYTVRLYTVLDNVCIQSRIYMVLWLYPRNGQHAATMVPAESASGTGTETEGPRTDQHGRTESAEQRGQGNEDGRTTEPPRTGERTAEPPAIIQAANGTKAPIASPRTADTDGPPQHGRTGGQEDRQRDRERREGPPQHLDSIDGRRAGEQESNGNGHGHGHGQQPPVIRRRKKQRRPRPDGKQEKQQQQRENLQALIFQASKISKGPSETRPRRSLRSAHTFYTE